MASHPAGEVVAGPLPTKFGARACPYCGNKIEKWAQVVKIADKGATTAAGQGPGFWVHETCD